MKIVNTTDGFSSKLGIREAVRLNCEAGFEGIDLSPTAEFYTDEYKTAVKDVRSIADSYGVPFVQSHGPIPKITTLSDTAGKEAILAKLHRAVEVSGMLGVKNMIIHPIRLADGSHEDQLGINLEFYSSVVAAARDAGVRLAIENMCGYKTDTKGEPVKHVCKTPEELKKFIMAFGSEWVTGCLDTGHARISGEAPGEFVRMMGRDYLSALHIQDCDGIKDTHTVPFQSLIDWESFTTALADIRYAGDITLEAVCFPRNMPAEIFPAAARYMAATARYLRDRVVAKMGE